MKVQISGKGRPMETISVDRQDHQHRDDFSVYFQHERWTRQQVQDYQARAMHACRYWHPSTPS